LFRTYLVSYDLDRPDRDYSKFMHEIARIGGVRILYAGWLVKCNISGVRLRDHLSNFIDADDRLVVLGLNGEAAWTKLMVSDHRIRQFVAA
jgi:hypothetical protein